MHTNRNDSTPYPDPRSRRTRGLGARTTRIALTAAMAALTGFATLVLADTTPASASTLNGIATIANPATLIPVVSGASTATFTVTLPSQSACDGDTATHGYHVYSYLVPKGTNLATVTFESFPSTGYGLVDNVGTYYGPVNTAIGTGQIVGIPNNFQWGPLVSADGVTLSQLLYTGSGPTASGIWEAGLVCADTHGALADNWNTEVTFNAHAADPNGFTWTAVPGPSGSAPAAFTSAASTTFTVNAANTFTPAASGSPVPTISESGALPSGVTFTGGALTGTPTVTGTYPITFTAHNGILADATQSFSLKVVVPVPGVTGIAPTTGPTSGGTSVTITGTNLDSATSVDFGLTAGAITADSATSITATSPGGSGTVDVTVTTAGGTSATSGADKFTYGTVPAFTSPTTTTFVVGTAGSFTPTATGSPTPTIGASGALPAGVTFSGGSLTGTPSAVGTFPIAFSASNGTGGPVTQSFTLTVVAIKITTTSLPIDHIGTAYSATLQAIGGVQPYKWKVTSGKLPKGLKLNSRSGVISGTVVASVKHPPVIGPYPVTVTVSDHTKGTKNVTTASLTLTLSA